MLRLALLALAMGGVAYADTPVASGGKPQPSEPLAPKPAPVEQPRPDQASGVEHEDARTDHLLWIPRTLLFVPRVAVWVAAQPFRGAAYAYEHYNIEERALDATFNDARTFGIYPVATYETGFGFNVGARLVYKNVFNKGETIRGRVNFGGRLRQAYGINIRSGERFGKRVDLEIDSSFERRPRERFFGIGNSDIAEMPPSVLIDPADSEAVETRFREDLIRNVVKLHARLGGDFHTELSGALMLRDFAGTDEADSITNYYDTSKLVGFTGTNNIYVEEALSYDSRRPTSRWMPRTIDATGWLVSVHGGMTTGVDADRSDFYTYGGEIQRSFDLYDGSRVLALRVLVESIYGSDGRTDGKLSFIDLPRLGGSEYLRGYPNGRFRDRSVGLASAEYTWDLGNYLAAYTFVDAGRPWSSLDDASVGRLRVGFGGGIELHTHQTFFTRAQIAASRDGDFFLELALNPGSGRRERAGRF